MDILMARFNSKKKNKSATPKSASYPWERPTETSRRKKEEMIRKGWFVQPPSANIKPKIKIPWWDGGEE